MTDTEDEIIEPRIPRGDIVIPSGQVPVGGPPGYYLRVQRTTIDVDDLVDEQAYCLINPPCPLCGGSGSGAVSGSGSGASGSGVSGESGSCYPCSLCTNGAPPWFFPELSVDPVLESLRQYMWLVYCFANCNVPGWLCETGSGGGPYEDPPGVIPILMLELTTYEMEYATVGTTCTDYVCDFICSSESGSGSGLG